MQCLSRKLGLCSYWYSNWNWGFAVGDLQCLSSFIGYRYYSNWNRYFWPYLSRINNLNFNYEKLSHIWNSFKFRKMQLVWLNIKTSFWCWRWISDQDNEYYLGYFETLHLCTIVRVYIVVAINRVYIVIVSLFIYFFKPWQITVFSDEQSIYLFNLMWIKSEFAYHGIFWWAN